MTAVVTGAAGHIGGNVVRALLRAEPEVRALVHRDTRAVVDTRAWFVDNGDGA